MKINWTPDSREDLESIYKYIAEDNPAAARTTIGRIRELAKLLSEFPYTGKPGRENGTRELVIPGGNYFIAYKIINEEIYILSVIHQSRGWPLTN